jgi:hypothetical protein
MAKGLFIAWMSPASEDQDAELNEWYNGTHMPQMVAAVPGITSVRRFRTADLPGQPLPHKYLAIYELESDDVQTAAAALAKSGQEGALDMTAAIDLSVSLPGIQWYQEIDIPAQKDEA